MSVAEKRAAAVAETVTRIRNIEAQRGVTREALDEIRNQLLQLAARRELFPAEDFPGPNGGKGDQLHLISCDPDDRFALYLNRGTSAHDTPPHDHTTWAVVVGLQGEEHNKFYERIDGDDDAPPVNGAGRGPVRGKGRGRVRVRDEFTVTEGTGVTLMPDDIHSIHMRGDNLKMFFHMYGLALPRLTGRVKFDLDEGTYEHFPATPNISDAR